MRGEKKGKHMRRTVMKKSEKGAGTLEKRQSMVGTHFALSTTHRIHQKPHIRWQYYVFLKCI